MKGDRLGEFEELTLLALRAVGVPSHAVPVQQYIQAAASRVVSLGAVYAALARLETKRFVHSRMGGALPVRGGKSKRLYEVTPEGLTVARELHLVRERIWREIHTKTKFRPFRPRGSA